MRKRLLRLTALGISAVMAGTLFVGGVAADPGGLPDIDGYGIVEVTVPDRDAIDALNGEWDLVEYVRHEADGRFTLNINTDNEGVAELAAMGFEIGVVVEDEGTWRERVAERDAAQAAEQAALDLAENGNAADDFQLFSSFVLPPLPIVVQRADYFVNYAGRFVSVEAHATGSTQSTGPTLAMAVNSGAGTPFGSAVSMPKYNDGGLYQYHRHLIRIGAAGSSTPVPTVVRVTSSTGQVAEVPITEWLPGTFPTSPPLPNKVVVSASASANGEYFAEGAAFGPGTSAAGVSGPIVAAASAPTADFPLATPQMGCGTFTGFPAGAIAIVNRGECPFVLKAGNAQAAGASAVIVVNNVAGAPINMGGTDPTITIPAIHVSQPDGATIRSGLPANGLVSQALAPNPYPAGFLNHFFTSYMDPTQVYNRIDGLATEFSNIAEMVDLPEDTGGYQRKSMCVMAGTTACNGTPGTTNQAVYLEAKMFGQDGGNQIRVQFMNPAASSSPLSITVAPNTLPTPTGFGSDIIVRLGTSSTGALNSTAAQVVAAINADPSASALVTAHTYAGSTGTGTVQARNLIAMSDFLNAPAHVERGAFNSRMIRIGAQRDGTKTGVFLYCQQHAREWATPLTCLETAERLVRNYGTDPLTTQLVDNLDIFIVPSYNPDGAHYSMYDFASQRKNLTRYCSITTTSGMPANRNGWGADNNRNNSIGSIFDGYDGASNSCNNEVYAGPFEFSEPENRNEAWVLDTFKNIKFANNIHSYGGYFMWAPGSYRLPGRITLPSPNIGVEAYFFAAGDLVLKRIKDYRGTVILPQRTGPIADVLYSAAGNSADDNFYRAGVIAYSFETGADRFSSTSTGITQSAVGFQPSYAGEGQHEAMEFANGNYGLLESAMAYGFDNEGPTVDFLVCDSLTPSLDCGAVTSNQAKQSGTWTTTFAFGNEPSVIRYTTDGSEPNMSSPTWEAQGPRRPGQLFEYDTTTTIKWFGTDIKGNVGATRTIKLSIDDVDPTISIVEPQEAVTQVNGDPGNYALNSEQFASYSCDDDDSGVISCVGTVADGAAFDTSSVGFHTFTVNAEDLAGNTASTTVTYNVVWDQWGGLRPPIADGAGNNAKAGSTVPVKFRLGANFGLNVLYAGYPLSQQVDCTTGAPIGGTTAITQTLVWATDQYQIDWKTDKAWKGQCRELIVKLQDNTVHTASFKFS